MTAAAVHDPEAERLILAAYMLRGADVQDEIEALVSDRDFYLPSYAAVFTALRGLKSRGAPTHSVALTAELTKMGRLGAVGGQEGVLSLTDKVPPPKSVEALCRAVGGLAAVRRMQEAAGAIYTDGYGIAAHDANDYLDAANAKIQLAAERREVVETSAGLGDAARLVIDRAFDAFNRGDSLTGISTGFTHLDKMCTGMHGGEFWVIAGRTSQGKSACGQAIALKIAAQDLPVLIISLEMPRSQWAERALSSLSDVPLERIRTASFEPGDDGRLNAAQMVLSRMPLDVDDGRSSVIDVRIKARKLKHKYGKIGAVVVDYLTLLKPAQKTESRELAVAEMSRGLKGLALELDVPVIALAQVNRGPEKLKDKRPMLSDLRESGSIEMDADVVMFVYRDEVYDKNTPTPGMGEFIVAKQRNGPLGTVHVRYVGDCVRFENVPTKDYHRGY